MLKHYESIQGDQAGIAQKMNEVSSLCIEIKFISVLPAMTQLQQPVLLCLVEFTFATETLRESFFKRMRPEPKISL